MLDRLMQFARSISGSYDALDGEKSRRPLTRAGRTEDQILNDHKRRLLSGTTQDIQRNFALAAWAIRQHLNYVSAFSFQCRTGQTGVDDAVEAFMRGWFKKDRCDVRKRHPFRRMIRLAEAMRVVHGDVLLLKLTGKGIRGRLQAVEGDRIRTPERADLKVRDEDVKQWVNGVKVDPYGAATHYAVHSRTDTYNGYALDRVIRADSAFVHGYYDRFDQVRGVSPIAAAINSLQDVYEGFDYTLAKVKVAQMFGLAIYRDATDGLDDAYATLDTDNDGTADDGYQIDFSGGPQLLDLAPGDRAEFLESRSPPTETINFLKLVIHVAIKALDLPFSFFDEAHTNFYGSRAGLIQYLHSCRAKIEDNAELLHDITRWRLSLAIIDGELRLPAGMTVDDVVNACEWVPAGVPWWDPAKEVKGHTAAIEKGLDNPQRVCRMTGTDYFDNIDRIAEALEYAKSKGVPMEFATMQQQPEVGIDDDNEESAQEGANVAN